MFLKGPLHFSEKFLKKHSHLIFFYRIYSLIYFAVICYFDLYFFCQYVTTVWEID